MNWQQRTLETSPTEMHHPPKVTMSRGFESLFCISPSYPCLAPTPVCDRRTDTWLCRVYTPLMTPTPSSTPAPHASSLSTTATTVTLRPRSPRARYGLASISHDNTVYHSGRKYKNRLGIDMITQTILTFTFRVIWRIVPTPTSLGLCNLVFGDKLLGVRL